MLPVGGLIVRVSRLNISALSGHWAGARPVTPSGSGQPVLLGLQIQRDVCVAEAGTANTGPKEALG